MNRFRIARFRSLFLEVLCIAAVTAALLAYLPATPQEELTVALDPMPPFMYWKADGTAAGAMPDLLNTAAKRAGITLKWVANTDHPEKALAPGTGIDVWPLLEVREARRKQFHITEPFARAETLLVRLHHPSGPVKSVGAGVKSHTRAWAKRAFPEARIELPEDSLGLAKLCEGKLDATLVETPTFDALLMNRPPSCTGVQFEVAVIRDLDTDYAFASTFAAADSADVLRQELGRMARDGMLDKIFQRYYPLSHYRSAGTFAETQTERASRLFQWSVAGLFGVCALLWIAMHRFRRKADEAIALANMRTQFLASISHELRTPLNGVLGIASALSLTSLDRTQKEYVGLIRTSGEILLRTVNEVLDFARLEAGKQPMQCKPVALDRVVEGVVSILAPVAQQKGLELAWVVERGVPPIIESDEGALRQILMNLLGNGLKFTEAGIVSLRITAQAIDDKFAYLRILVSDSGPGIPAGQEEAIFNPFVRSSDSRTQAVVGTGLGLSITKQLVVMLAGRIWAKNHRDGGCVFHVEIPAALPSIAPAVQPGCYSDYPLPKHALLLTRKAISGDMLALRLAGVGCQVTRPANLEAAFAAQQAGARWDLLVVDDALEGDCLEIAQTLQAGQPDLHAATILLATGQQAYEALAARIPKGMTVYPKPFLSELFCSALERLTSCPNAAASPARSQFESSGERPEAVETSGLFELHKATAGGSISPPGCYGEGQGCEICIREKPGILSACLAASLSAHGGGSPAEQEPLVLVADDNPVNRKVISSLLRTMGLVCEAVESGEEAVLRFAERRFAWVVMDWHMPGMDGLTAIGRIRELERAVWRARTPVILCSATNEREYSLEKVRDDVDGILPKPISMRSLREAMIRSSQRASSRELAPNPHRSPVR
ncbi:MAG: response regulator [Bryobacterales bacterium]|nr:response regulator [Bryobacterales bacterium]